MLLFSRDIFFSFSHPNSKKIGGFFFVLFLFFIFWKKITKLPNFATKKIKNWLIVVTTLENWEKKTFIIIIIVVVVFTILKTCSGSWAGWMFVFCARFRRFAPHAHARANTQTVLPESVFSFSSLLSLSLSATSAATVVLRRLQIQFCEASMQDLSSSQ